MRFSSLPHHHNSQKNGKRRCYRGASAVVAVVNGGCKDEQLDNKKEIYTHYIHIY